MGDTSQGTVLRGQVQGVKRGVGITISANGAISVDPVTITGVIKTNNVSAFNSYIWPNTNGTDNQILTTSDDGTLSWGDVSDDFFKNVFTAKGQLIVGTGVKSYTLQNVGVNTAFLVADSTTTSGLIYTNNMTSAVLLPVGTSAQRDCYCVPTQGPLTGQFRYSTTYKTLEFYNGTQWVQVAASDITIETFVKQTVPLTGTASAVIIGGTSAERQNAPLAGYFRYNTSEKVPEFYDGTVWNTFIHNILPGTTGLTFTGVPTPEAGIVQVGGTLVLANGGTGATTQPGAANNILPPQATNSKKFLTTDGTNVSWSTVDGNGALTAGAGIGIAAGTLNTTVVSNTGIITNTAGLGIGVSTTAGNSTITNTGVRKNIAGFGIKVDNATGDSTISLGLSQAPYYDPIFIIPGVTNGWGSTTGLGFKTYTYGPYTVNYPVGPNRALMFSRLRLDLGPYPGASYATTGVGFVINPTVNFTIQGNATTGRGTFGIDLEGFSTVYSNNVFYPSGTFMVRTDELILSNPTTGGTFDIYIAIAQDSSGPNQVNIGFPQIEILPFTLQ
jgi:hypothetical protein